MTQERAIRLHNKPLIPMDLVDSASEMDSYLTQLREDSIKHERIRLRVARTQQTRINKSLEAAARKITVESVSTGSDPQTQKTKTWKCKKEKPSESQPEEPTEGSLVVETVKGIWCVCNNCGHKFVHHSKNLSSQYYCTCGKCHANIRLKHYK